MNIKAVLFDIDGTLVDSNQAHVTAWTHAFEQHGHRIHPERIAREIGKGGEMLVRSILGRDTPQADAQALGELESEHFRHFAHTTHLALLPGAQQALAAMRARGLKTALATSSGMDQLDALMQSARFDLRQRVDVTITADDVDKAKPHPDPLLAAASELSLEPQSCVMIGDTIYDALAAQSAGMSFVGVASWVWSIEQLLDAGARGAWSTPAELIGHFESVLASIRHRHADAADQRAL